MGQLLDSWVTTLAAREKKVQPEQIVSADAGPIWLCTLCRERIAMPCQYH